MARAAAQPEGCWAKGRTAGLTLDIQQREVVVVGGLRCQGEVETVAALRLIPVHDADCLDQLWGEGRGEHQCCFHSLSQGPTCRVQPAASPAVAREGRAFSPADGQWDQQSDSHCDRGCTGRLSGRRGQMGKLALVKGAACSPKPGLGGFCYLAWLGILTHSSFIGGGKLRWIVIDVQDSDTERGPRHLGVII